jgi:hypothetical protein
MAHVYAGGGPRRCAVCNREAAAGKLTCGRTPCNERAEREKRDRAVARDRSRASSFQRLLVAYVELLRMAHTNDERAHITRLWLAVDEYRHRFHPAIPARATARGDLTIPKI